MLSHVKTDPPLPLMQGVTVSDVDQPANFAGGNFSLSIDKSGGSLGLRPASGFSVVGADLVEDGSGLTVGTISGLGTLLVQVALNGNATSAAAQAAVRAFGFEVSSVLSTIRQVTLTFNDGGNSGSGGALAASAVQTITLPYNFIYRTTHSGETLTGTFEADYLFAGDGNDVVLGAGGDDRLYGQDGNDVLVSGEGSDIIYGGNGRDKVDYGGAAGAVFVDLVNHVHYETALTTGTVTGATAAVSTDVTFGVENVTGSAFGDRVYGDAADNVVAPGAGSDVVYGGNGTDTIDYGGAAGAVFVDLVNHVHYETALTTGTVTGATAAVSTDVTFGVENVTGSAFGDRVYGDAADNVVAPGAGSDVVYGGNGTDTIDYGGAAGAVFVDLVNHVHYETALTTGTVTGATAAISTDVTFEVENVIGSAFGDRLYGTAGVNRLEGGAGDDISYGLDLDDFLLGGDGADRLVGGNGQDTLTGGAGADRFYFVGSETGGADTITDYSLGSDLLYMLAANFGAVPGGTATLVIDGAAVAPNTFVYNSTNGMLSFDADGNSPGAAVDLVNIGPALSLTSADIMFYS